MVGEFSPGDILSSKKSPGSGLPNEKSVRQIDCNLNVFHTKRFFCSPHIICDSYASYILPVYKLGPVAG